jgi:peptide/nickel transport system permease protein
LIRFLLRRVVIMIPVLLGITVLNFGIIRLAPGDPADIFISASTTQADIDLKREQLGLNVPAWQQYLNWLFFLARGDFGFSFGSYESVSRLVLGRVGPTLILMGSGLMLAYAFAIPVGIFSAVRQYSKLDYFIMFLSFLGISVPPFFLGLLGIFLFSLTIPLFPSGGIQTLGGSGGILDLLTHLALPAVVLAAGLSGKMVRYVRASVLEILAQDYLRTARAKGLSEFLVIGKHAFRNALIPIITVIGLDAPLLIGGAVVTEQVFQWPGIGQLTIQAITSRDYPILMAVNFLSAATVLGVNLIVDILYSFANPTVKF